MSSDNNSTKLESNNKNIGNNNRNIEKIPNICKLSETLLNNSKVKEEIKRKVRKHYKLNKDYDTIY